MKKAKAEVRPLVLVATQAGETRELEFKQDSIIIGSGPTANVTLDGDDVSTIHAIIKMTMETATLIDLGSETGTRVNGKEVREARLKDGDTIRIGSGELAVELPAVITGDESTSPVRVGGPKSIDGEPTVNVSKPKEPSSPTIHLDSQEVNTVDNRLPPRAQKPIIQSGTASALDTGTQPQTPNAKRAKMGLQPMGVEGSQSQSATRVDPRAMGAEPSKTMPGPAPMGAEPSKTVQSERQPVRTSQPSRIAQPAERPVAERPERPVAGRSAAERPAERPLAKERTPEPRAPKKPAPPPSFSELETGSMMLPLPAEPTAAEDPVSPAPRAPRPQVDDGALPELDGRLIGVELDALGMPKAVVNAELAKGERGGVDGRSLQIAVYWGNELLQVRHFDDFDTLTLGEDAGNTIVAAADGLPPSMIFARAQGGSVQLTVPDALPLELKVGNNLLKREQLFGKGRLQATDGVVACSVFELGMNERLALGLGALTIVAQYVTAAEKTRSTLAERLDQAFIGTLVFVALFALFTFVMVLVSPRTEENAADDLFKAQQRFATLLLKEQQRPQKKFQLSGKDGGKQQNEDGKPGRKEIRPRDVAPSVKGAPRVDPQKREKDRKIALNAGILGALKGGKAEAVSNVFGPGGLGTGINNALGGLKGSATGDAGGLGGLGSKGTGPGAGGHSLGIGGIGNAGAVGTGGLGNVDLGGRGRSERSVEHGRTVIVGGLSQEAIKRVLDRAQSQLRYCYEKELQRNPDLYGKVTAKFTIGGTGSVTDAQTMVSTMNNANVEDCLLRVFRRLRFPNPQGGGVVDVSYPMIYKPSGD